MDFKNKYKTCYYVPVSFSLFLIALTFPVTATTDIIATYNVWLSLLFRVLPIDAPFDQYLLSCNFDTEKNPINTRTRFVNFVFDMHRMVLGETLHKTQTLAFFECLRANDCSHATKTGEEATCRRTTQKTESVCIVLSAKEHKNDLQSSFLMDPIFQITHISAEVEIRAMQNEQAFCSCIFSAKWFLLHMIASKFPEDSPTEVQRYIFHTFLTLFGKMLACFACRVNFQSNLELVHYEPNKHLLNRATFVNLMYNLHNTVNGMLHKKESNIIPITLQQVQDFFMVLETSTTMEHKCNILIAKQKDVTSRFYFLP